MHIVGRCKGRVILNILRVGDSGILCSYLLYKGKKTVASLIFLWIFTSNFT